MKKRISKFYIFYFIFTGIVVAALGCFIIILNGWLSNYENSRPGHYAEKIFEEYYESRDFKKLIEASEIKVSEFENEENISEYYKRICNGKEISYSESSGENKSDTIKYFVSNGEYKFSSFTIKKSDKTSKGGYPVYELLNIELLCYADGQVIAEIPENYKLFVNSISVDEEYLEESEIETESCRHMPSGVRGIYYNRYKINDLVGQVEVSVCDSFGNAAEISYDEEKHVYKAQILYDDSIEAEHGEFIIEATKEYAKYMQSDSVFNAVKKYFDPSSDLYVNIKTAENYFVLDHSGYYFEDVKLSEFYRYDDNTFSARISLVHALTRDGMEDYKDHIDKTLYLRVVNGQYLIYDSFNNN